MELTLTGGSTLGDNDSQLTPVHSNGGRATVGGVSGSQQQPQGHHHHHGHSHNHGHGHGHNHGHGQCCGAPPPRAPPKIDASTLLPTEEQVRRFRTDRQYRLNILSNVVRGGPYPLFMDLIRVLISSDEGDGGAAKGGNDEGGGDEAARGADPVVLAPLLDGYGTDGHTLAHWCAKRGELLR